MNLAVGDRFPAATLIDTDGRVVTLSDAFGAGPATVVFFYRGRADPWGRATITATVYEWGRLVPENLQIIGISSDLPSEGRRLLEQITRDCLEDRPFISLDPYPLRLLSDPDGKLIEELGLLSDDEGGSGVKPATVVIDPAGIVRWMKVDAKDDADVGGPNSAARAAMVVVRETTGAQEPHPVASWWIGQPGG